MAAVQRSVKFQDQTGAIIKQRFIGFLLQFSEDSQRDEAAGAAASQTSEGASFSQSQPPHHVRTRAARRQRPRPRVDGVSRAGAPASPPR